MTKDILVIDKDSIIFESVRENLQDANTRVYHITSAEEALKKLSEHTYSLVIMDVLLSDKGGHAIITTVRQLSPMPLLILSEDASTEDKVLALKNGADGCLDKFCEADEYLAHARAMLRRYTELNHMAQRSYAVVCHENLLLDPARRRVSVDGVEVSLSPKEYQILLCLLKNRSRIVTFEIIYEVVWNQPYLNDASTILYRVGNLRRKLGSPDWIESVYGVGYCLRGLTAD